jgi:hypothetical protein
MLLLEKPQHRTYPSEFRYRIEFESNNVSTIIPPLYVYIDNARGWNIDTLWTVPALRDQINKMFESVYTAHFDVLTTQKILDAAKHADAIKTLCAQLKGPAAHPLISVRYYDLEVTYPIPGKRIKISKIHRDDILDDITKR